MAWRGPQRQGGPHAVKERLDAVVGAVDAEGLGAQAAGVEEVVDQRGQVAGGVVDVGEELGVARRDGPADAVGDDRHKFLNDGQRCAEFVGDVVDESVGGVGEVGEGDVFGLQLGVELLELL